MWLPLSFYRRKYRPLQEKRINLQALFFTEYIEIRKCNSFVITNGEKPIAQKLILIVSIHYRVLSNSVHPYSTHTGGLQHGCQEKCEDSVDC